MGTMSPKDFRRWRKVMDLSQKDAAEALGLKRRVVQYYEKGERDGEKVEVPKYVRLACYALLQGVKDYKGPPKDEAEKDSAGDEVEAPDVIESVAPDSAAGPAAAEVPVTVPKARGKSAGRRSAAKSGETPAAPEGSA